MIKKNTVDRRIKKKERIRKKIHGTTALPRLTVYRSLKHAYAQIVDDTTGRTLVSASSNAKEMREEMKGVTKPLEMFKKVGAAVAKKALEKNISTVVFDRNGYLYHGRVKALADGAREAGLKF